MGAVVQNLANSTTFFNGRFDAVSVTIVICCALAVYNALELLLLILTTFRRFRGLYFWSLIIASCGLIPYTIGLLIEFFELTAQSAGLVFSSVGWIATVSGQSVVLYSRLGVVLGKSHGEILRVVKWVIIVDGIVFHTSTIVVVFGAYYVPGRHFVEAYKYIEKLQMTGFTIQEFALSGIYIWRTLEILKSSALHRERTHRVLWQLFAINVLIVVMDIALLVQEYQDRHVIEQGLKAAVYSVKLKLEFAILSKLVGISKNSDQTYLGALEDQDDFFSPNRAQSTGTEQGLTLGDSLDQRGAYVDTDKSTTAYVERAGEQNRTASIATIQEKQKRRTLDEDLYAGACRDMIA